MQGEGALQPTLGLERKGREAGVGCRLALLQCRKAPTAERHTRQRQAGCHPGLQERCSFRLLPGGGCCGDKQVPCGTMVELHHAPGHGQEQGGEARWREGTEGRKERRCEAEEAQGLWGLWGWV